MHNSSELVNFKTITSFQAIHNQLIKLKKLLRDNDAKQFIVFNDAYLIVTSNIKQASETGHFENPKFIEKFCVSFARYYFEAINKTVQAGELPDAWSTLNTVSRNKTTPNFILLLLGANAHINHDLALALVKLMEHEESDDLLRDVTKIDKILMKSGREVITTFNESSKSLNFLKQRFIFLYYRPTMYMIRFWRIRAWSRYKSIRKHGLEDSNYAVGSVKIARRFLLLGRYFG